MTQRVTILPNTQFNLTLDFFKVTIEVDFSKTFFGSEEAVEINTSLVLFSVIFKSLLDKDMFYDMKCDHLLVVSQLVFLPEMCRLPQVGGSGERKKTQN